VDLPSFVMAGGGRETCSPSSSSVQEKMSLFEGSQEITDEGEGLVVFYKGWPNLLDSGPPLGRLSHFMNAVPGPRVLGLALWQAFAQTWTTCLLWGKILEGNNGRNSSKAQPHPLAS
jgi:hypothetical protein